jgi:hypothetical protein
MGFQFFNFIVENLGLNQSSKQKINNIVIGLESIIVHSYYQNFHPTTNTNKKCVFTLNSKFSLMIDDDNHFYANDNHHPYHNTYYDFLSNVV